MNPYLTDNIRQSIKANSRKQNSEQPDVNSYAAIRQARSNFQGSNSIGGLHADHNLLNKSVDHGGSHPIHSQSQNYPLNFTSGEIKQNTREDLLATDDGVLQSEN